MYSFRTTRISDPTVQVHHFCAVHRLIYRTFNGLPPPVGLIVDHADNDPNNNSAVNLRWATPAQNAAYRATQPVRAKIERAVVPVVIDNNVELRNIGIMDNGADLQIMKFPIMEWLNM